MNIIIDTKCANINSLKFAIERHTPEVQVSSDPATIRSADRVFLPGVGSANFAMEQIQKLGLAATIQNLTQPVLGICLGMQLLLSRSDEGETTCLDIIQGQVKGLSSEGQRLPHMGWNTLSSRQDHPLFQGLVSEAYFYFVHSYAVVPGSYSLATCTYGEAFTAVLSRENFYGVQFHPERSGPAGSQLLKNFLELQP